jgi:membrane-bound serine protease (ClpP class)
MPWRRIGALVVLLTDEVIFTTFFFAVLPIFNLYPPVSSYLVIMAVLIAKDVIIIKLIWRILINPPLTGKESLIGKTGVVYSDLDPQGVVRIENEFWKGEADEPLRKGQIVVVKQVDGLLLRVKPLENSST